MLEIVNRGHRVPWSAVRHVRRSLRWIYHQDLDGLSFIELVDKMPDPTIKSPERIREAFTEGYGVYGLYHYQTKNSSAHVTLNIKDICRGIPSIYWWTTVPTLLIASTLAHEVAHHVVARRGYINEPGETRKYDEYDEAFAYRYAFEVRKRMMGKWYYRFGVWAIKDLAQWQYYFGIHDWSAGKYAEAAKHWYRAWSLDTDHRDAEEWYWRAREICSENQNNKN